MPKPKVIAAVHIYGRRCGMESIHAYAEMHGLYVIEDLAEAHGIRPHQETHAACYSYYKNKIIHGEEGGAVWFRSPEHARLARELRTLGFTEAHDFYHTPRGHNYRLSNTHAVLIIDSLRRVDHNIQERKRIEAWYNAHCPGEWQMPPREVVWVYDIRIPGLSKDRQTAIVRTLNANGIAARLAFQPMSLQEEFKHCRTVGGQTARRMAQEVLYLPVIPGATTEESAAAAFGLIRRALGA